MAEEQKIGYVYLNSAYDNMGYEIGNNLNQATARYKITDPDNVIIYIDSIETQNNIVGGKLYSNTYYFLGKPEERHTIRGDCWEIFMRGEGNGTLYNSNEMDIFQYNGSWDMTGKTEYTLGGTGMNGRINYDYIPYNYSGFPHNMMGFSHQSYYVNFPDSPDEKGMYIGWTKSQLSSMQLGNLAHYVNYPTKPTSYKNRLVKPEYLYNVYSSAYTGNSDDTLWWTDMQDIRQLQLHKQ